MSYKSLFLFIVSFCLISGCASFEKIGKNLGKGVASESEQIGANLLLGIRNELTDSVTRIKVAGFLDSLITSVVDTTGKRILKPTDSIFIHKVIPWADSIVNALLGPKVQADLEKLQYTLVGKTKEDVLEMKAALQQLIVFALSDSTQGRIGMLRDELLGSKTDSAVSKIVEHAMTQMIVRYNKDLNPVIKDDISFVGKNAKELLFLTGAIALGIIFFVWLSRRKYLKLVSVLSKHINEIPDQKIFDQITSNIKKETVPELLEPALRKVLEKNGMLGKDSWDVHAAKTDNKK
ncbi:MAG: hypothetical protein IPG39_08295 [Bacteroidetes bacterium]|nr:hypothetical protein [Bacteroidota bacterium]